MSAKTAALLAPGSLLGGATALLAGLALLVGAARADQVTTTMSGKVATVQATGNPDAVSQLAAEGVHVGDSASFKIVIESTTLGQTVTGGPYDFQQYDMAVTDLRISVGSWNAHFAPPAGFETLNFVQVANDVNQGVKFDSWSGSALGLDSPLILSTSQPGPQGTFLFVFTSVPPKASSNEDLVQDLLKYKSSRLVSFAGPGGVITVDLTAGGGGGGGSTADPTALARQGELKAAGKLASKLLKGLAKLVGKPPESDPLGTAKDQLLTDSADDFGADFLAAVNKALKKGGSAPLDGADKQAATDELMKGLTAQTEPLAAWADLSDPAARALASRLDKALAAALHAEFVAQAADAKKPNAGKLADKLDKARAKLTAQIAKALDKAAKQGVSYGGPDSDAIVGGADDVVDGYVALTKTGAP